MKEIFIYRKVAHIGQSTEEKNIDDAAKRCWFDKETSYHGIAFVPNSDKVLILTKFHASMARDEKTRKKTEEGKTSKKNEYLLIMELRYKKSNQIEDGHDLGIFVQMGRSFCTSCVARRGNCRHCSE